MSLKWIDSLLRPSIEEIMACTSEKLATEHRLTPGRPPTRWHARRAIWRRRGEADRQRDAHTDAPPSPFNPCKLKTNKRRTHTHEMSPPLLPPCHFSFYYSWMLWLMAGEGGEIFIHLFLSYTHTHIYRDTRIRRRGEVKRRKRRRGRGRVKLRRHLFECK